MSPRVKSYSINSHSDSQIFQQALIQLHFDSKLMNLRIVQQTGKNLFRKDPMAVVVVGRVKVKNYSVLQCSVVKIYDHLLSHLSLEHHIPGTHLITAGSIRVFQPAIPNNSNLYNPKSSEVA